MVCPLVLHFLFQTIKLMIVNLILQEIFQILDLLLEDVNGDNVWFFEKIRFYILKLLKTCRLAYPLL